LNPYDYQPDCSSFNLTPVADRRSFRSFTLRFKAAAANPDFGGHIAQAEYYQPQRSAKVPLAVIAHGMGDTSLIPARALGRSMVAHGWAAYVPILTNHSRRTPRILKPETLSLDDWFEIYRTSVIEIRQGLDWAETRPEIDSEKVAVIGVSFGGFVAAIAMALDNRVKAGILVESGGNGIRINELSPTMRRHYPGPPIAYKQVQAEFQAFLAEAAAKGIWNVEPPYHSFLNDPLTFAPLLRGRKVMMINGWYDALIPRAAAREMYLAAGARESLWLPAGHLSLWLWFPVISRKIRVFLARNLLAPSSSRRRCREN
jgi:dienelactone hydrolase